MPRSLEKRVLYVFGQQRNKIVLVVAKHDYPKGTTITDPEQMFDLREFLEVDAPVDADFGYSEISDAWRGSFLRNDIYEGQPLETVGSVSLEPPSLEALLTYGKLEPPGPGREYISVTTATSRDESIRVGTLVDVVEMKGRGWPPPRSKEDLKGGSRILLHDVSVRAVIPPSIKFLQIMLDKEGEGNLVALQVIVEASAKEEQIFQGLRKKYATGAFFEIRPSVDNKKVDNKNSPKVP